jgi:hypothetical protein
MKPKTHAPKFRLALAALACAIVYLLLLHGAERIGVRKDALSSVNIAASGLALVANAYLLPSMSRFPWLGRCALALLQAFLNYAVLFAFSRWGRKAGIPALASLALANIAAFYLAMNL